MQFNQRLQKLLIYFKIKKIIANLLEQKEKLDQAINSQPSLNGMTQESINNYTTKRREAQNIASSADTIINNGDASIEQITENKIRVEEATNALNEAKQHLTADTTLKTEVRKLSREATQTTKSLAVLVLITILFIRYNLKLHRLKIEQILSSISLFVLLKK